jgi:intracellular sulfur oxidation DsrE/DsrF family protein
MTGLGALLPRKCKVDAKKVVTLLCTVLLFLGTGKAVFARGQSNGAIHVDIPVKLDKANVVFDIGRPSFIGDMPLAMRYMHLLAKRVKDQGVTGNIVGVFYGSATYMVLNDKAYNSFRKVSTGNPYKQLVAELLKQNVRLEVCAVALHMHHWNNSDLLPGVKVNAGGVLRIVQLVQEGYVHMQP